MKRDKHIPSDISMDDETLYDSSLDCWGYTIDDSGYSPSCPNCGHSMLYNDPAGLFWCNHCGREFEKDAVLYSLPEDYYLK